MTAGDLAGTGVGSEQIIGELVLILKRGYPLQTTLDDKMLINDYNIIYR